MNVVGDGCTTLLVTPQSISENLGKKTEANIK
jgi:hypothetical protein